MTCATFVFWWLLVGFVLVGFFSVLDSALSSATRAPRVFTRGVQIGLIVLWPSILVSCVRKREKIAFIVRCLALLIKDKIRGRS